ncbi:MAG: TonB-dependent receptor [Phycisphaerae bacterium]
MRWSRRRLARSAGALVLALVLLLPAPPPALAAKAEASSGHAPAPPADGAQAPADAAGADLPPVAADAEPGAAEAPELLLWQEIPTVVSASRHEEPASRAPNAVSVIPAEEIHGSGLMVLGDVLRLAPGVDVGRIDGWNYGVGVRGLHGRWANLTLVLMDGRSIYNPVWGGVSWGWQPVLLEDIDRIEVVRGPGGAAWGANAANGVINIITKKPKETQGFFVSQTLTSRLDSLTHMRYGVSEGPLDLRLSAGYDSMPELGVREGDGNHDFVRLPRVNLRSTYHLDEERTLDIDAGYLDGVTGSTPEPVALSGRRFADARWFPQTEFARARYTHRRGRDDTWHLQYFMNRQTMSESDGGVWVRYTQHDVEAVRTQPVGERHTLTYGGNIRVDHMTNGDPPTGSGAQGVRLDNRRTHDHQAGLFVQDRWELADHWTAILGARADRNSYTGWEWAGRGTVLYHPAEAHTFRLSVARAFRTTSLLIRSLDMRLGPTGLPAPLPAHAFLTRGNEDANASYVKAYEFGYTYQREWLRLGAEFFWNNYRGLIGPVTQTPVGAVPRIDVFQNAVDGDLYGFELTGTWQATDRLRLDGWYVWEQWVRSGTRAPGDQPIHAAEQAVPPQQKVGLGARYQLADGLAANARFWWVDEVMGWNANRIPPWSRCDINVAKQLGEHCELTVGVMNAFDGRHRELNTAVEEPVEVGERTWYVRFQAKF